MNMSFNFEFDEAFRNKYRDAFKDMQFILEHENMNVEMMFKDEILKKYFNTIISYLYKGDVNVLQNFSIKNCVKGSILSKLIHPKNTLSREFRKEYEIDTFVLGQYFLTSLIQLLKGKGLINNVIIMSELKKLGNKRFQEKVLNLENCIKVKSLEKVFENLEFTFPKERDTRYKKFKELSPESFQRLKKD
jgi:hypothetical protein